MAKPIKETPVLKGKDAKAFIDKMNTANNARVEKNARAKMRENFNKLHAISKF